MRYAGAASGAASGTWAGSLQAAVAAALCVLMVEQPLLAGAQAVRRGPTAGAMPKIVQMQGDDRILHALNRLTFGPRPGDVAAVKAMGLDKWFETQLNPAQIDDSVLEAKLAMFPAMQLSQAELERKYPGQQTLKRMADTNAALPTDPVEHAIYLAGVAQYKIQAERRAEAAKTEATTGGAMAAGVPAGAGMADNSMAGGSDNSMANGTASAATPAAPGARQRRRPQAPAPGADPAVASASAPGDMAGGDMMAGAQNAATTDATAPLPKSDVMDAPPPAEHVEALFRDLDAVKILDLPPDERFQKIIAMTPKQMQAFRQSLDGAEQAELAQGLSPQQREVLAALQGSNRMVSGELLQSRLMRDIYSDRQIQAVMTDFWLNHFNVYIRKNQNEPYLIPEYVRQTILPHALGKFEDLLVATAESPAMLVYLDNAQSVGPKSQAAQRAPRLAQFAQNPQVKAALKDRGLNENYGRELMELHTLGVNGGYTQADVTNVAKVFTGWSVGQGGFGGGGARGGGGFAFNDRTHEPGPKVVLGTTIQEGGMNEGLQVLHMLATSPATAKFISTKLAVRFVSDDPPPALVDRMANAFLASDGDIKVVLRTMFQSPEFWAKSVQRAKVKTPEEFVVSAVRASGATVNNAQGLVQALDKLGMPLYGMQTPNGYSWMSEPWVSTGALVSRMNFALVMAGDKLPGTRTDWAKLMGDAPAPSGVTTKPVSMDTSALTPTPATAVDPEVAAKERKLELLLLGERVSDRTRATVLAQSNDSTAAIEAAKEFQGGRPGSKGAPGGATYDPLLPLANARRPGPGPANGVTDDRQAAVMAGLLLGSPEFQRR